jgi:hypothetical protein
MAEAKINREYALRVMGVGLLMFGICGWSLYDGTVAWPRHNLDMERVRPALLATNLTAEAWLAREEDAGGSRLEAAFTAQGVKTPSKLVRKIGELRLSDSVPDRDAARAAQLEQVRKTFENPVYSGHDLQTQFVQAAVTLLLGLWAFAAVGLKARKRFVADGNGLSGSGVGSRPVAYGEVRAADWSKWDEKGIVRLTLASGIRLTLDGWHFAGIAGIVDELVKHRPDLAPRAAQN